MTRRKPRPVALRISCATDGSRRWDLAAPSPAALPAAAKCSVCGQAHDLHLGSITSEGGLIGCVACGHPELYARRSVSPRVGLAIVLIAACLAPSTRYVSLGVAALLDLLLFWLMPEVVECYVCKAVHRGFVNEPRHPRFDHQIAERLRFGPRAVMGKPMRATGTGGAPEPEH